MASWRNYSPAVRAALVSLSQGTCYYPGCDKRILEFVGSVPELNVDIAHICALKSDGPRYDGRMSDEERNSFDNLILLCKVHHRHVDQTKPSRYSVTMLRQWKLKREASGKDVLKGLSGLTEDRLQELLSNSIKSFNDEMTSAIDKLANVDLEAATLLRGLIVQLNGDVSRRYIVDPDVANLLVRAAEGLRHLPDVAPFLNGTANSLKHLPETTSLLHGAADRLGHLQDTASLLKGAADSLRQIQDAVVVVNRAAERLGYLQDAAPLLKGAADRLGHLQETAPLLKGAADRLGQVQDAVAVVNRTAGILEELRTTSSSLNRAAERLAHLPDTATTLMRAAERWKGARDM